MRMLAYVRTLAMVSGGVGCALPPTVVAPHNRAAVIVHNESPFDIDVFVWDAEERATWIGYLSAGDTASFDVPATVIAATGPYSLEARIIDGARHPIRSQTFALRPGYRITWGIPPADAVGAAAEGLPSDTTDSSEPTTGPPPAP